MRKFGIFFLAAGALSLGACSEATTEEEVNEEVEVVTYSLDAEKSSLEWAAQMSPEYGHEGTIDFKSGTMTMENGELKDGSFVIDMTSINNTDQPEEKAAALESHLTGMDADDDHPKDLFFNAEDYPTAQVKLGEYKDGKLTTTLMIRGSEMTQDVPVEITSDENGASITGEFSMDFSSLNMPGMVMEHGSIEPNFNFKLNAVLTK